VNVNWNSQLIRSGFGRFCLERMADFYDRWICTPEAVRRQAAKEVKQRNGLRFSVGIPHYNRGKLIYRPLFNLLHHPLVNEVVIVDDGSIEEEYRALMEFVDSLHCGDRVKVFRRNENRGALLTKLECVERCDSEWVLLLDSDNTAFRGYLDGLGRIQKPKADTFYCAEWAWPRFSFRALGIDTIDFSRAVSLCRDGRLRRHYIINDGNYLVNRGSYCHYVSRIGEIPSDVVDVMVVNYLWLSGGGKLQMLSGKSYNHRVDSTSFYIRTEDFSKKRLLDLFQRFESGETCGDEYLQGLRDQRF
jgi:glycosyltransferase involved in cell wall biosynthesis